MANSGFLRQNGSTPPKKLRAVFTTPTATKRAGAARKRTDKKVCKERKVAMASPPTPIMTIPIPWGERKDGT